MIEGYSIELQKLNSKEFMKWLEVRHTNNEYISVTAWITFNDLVDMNNKYAVKFINKLAKQLNVNEL